MSGPPAKDAGDVLTAQEKLRRLYRGLVRLPVAVLMADAEGNIEFVNDRFVEMTGYEPAEAIGQCLWSLQCEKAAPGPGAQLQETVLAQGGWHGEMVNRRKNGELYWETISICAGRDENDKVTNFVVVKEDISELKRTEEALRASEEQLKAKEVELREAQRIARVGSWSWEPATDTVYWSEETYRVCGFDPSKGAPSFARHGDLFSPSDMARLKECVDRALQEGTPYQLDLLMLCPDKSRWITVQGEATRDAEGRVTGIRGSLQDITERKRAEEELQAQRQLLESVIYSLPAAVLITQGSELRVKMINPAYSQIASGREVLGRNFPDVWPEIPALKDIFLKVLETGEPYIANDQAYEISRFPGGPPEKRYFSWSLYRVRLPGDEGWGLLNTAWETTERKQNEDALLASEEKFRSFFEHAAVGMGRVRFADARWIDVNGAFCRMLGYSSDEMKAIPWPQITHPEDVDLDLIPFRRMAVGELEAYSVEKRFIHKDGHHVWARLTLSLVRTAAGRPDYEIAVIEDISERRRSEAERDRLLAEVQRSNQELQQFAYIASHDLQEPLRMISGYIALMERKYGSRLDERARTYINYAVDGTRRMQRLIDGLLNYSRISREAELVPVDMNAVFAVATANLEQRIRESGGRVTATPLPVVRGDEIQLVQLLQNLVGNGLKYRKPGASPKVHLSARQTGAHWLFAVRDNGIGIERQHYDRIFQIFQRLHTEDEYPGTGIGLATCKKIVERHGGRIWVESKPGGGSTFFFTLPVGDKQEGAELRPPAKDAS
ncbi:PAS domain S-box protein [Geotalea sp. SG265]|uniref:PAS domain-containing sensor histidine kinase n=1 Tax=Geotalea sp. SG265 TaxID=2922867 RepID=UPI001FAF128C|nr:PAS domain S-box protein [Geotalea sp. SG265]